MSTRLLLFIAILIVAHSTTATCSSCSADKYCIDGEKLGSSLLRINWGAYELDKIPDMNSAVVAIVREEITSLLDLETLVKDLGRVGDFIKVAYYAVGAAGPRFTELQIKVQRRGYEITRLCDKSALTVQKFKSTSWMVLQHLQSSYEFLLDGFEEMALETHSSISKLADDMQHAAYDLHAEFDDQATKVNTTLEETQIAKGGESIRITNIRKEQRESEEQRKAHEKLVSEVKELEDKAAQELRTYEMKEDEEINNIGNLNIFEKVANVVTSKIGLGEFFDDGGAAVKAERWRQKRIDALKIKNEIRDRRHNLLLKMQTFATKIRECQSEEETAQIAIESLHQAVGALKELSLVMLQASHFWKQMEENCKDLSEPVVSQQITKALAKYPVDVRQKVWNTPAFKRGAITNYAQWMAIGSVCGTYLEHIKKTQTDLYNYIRENPTYEECRQNLKTIASTFLRNLQSDQKAIADKSFRAEEEIKKLRKS